MDFSLSTEQQLLQDHLKRFWREQPDDGAIGQARWHNLLVDFGLGALVPQAGAESLHIEHALVAETLGSELVHEPFLESIVIAGHLLADMGGPMAEVLLERMALAQALPVLAWAEPAMRYDFRGTALQALRTAQGWALNGRKCMVKAAPLASHFLLLARTAGRAGEAPGLSLFVLERDTQGLCIKACPTVDGRLAADLYLQDVQLERAALLGEEGGALPHLERVRDIAVAALCAEAKGLLGQMLEQTRVYLGERRQFGQRLASFQVLQHRLVDMYLHLVKAASASRLATLRLGEQDRRSQAASSAQVVVAAACRFIGQAAVQLHGGMGMCDDVRISHYFRRATVIEREFGSRDFHLARYNALYRTVP